ncbi:MAG: PAS domain S-box protein [Proteobacteria bacterium]|nr:PAS domain S-box protein [Pseudomonadota bacterium]MBU1584463.1 PAS domain S-box protein [Pseudomonadota bacterium]
MKKPFGEALEIKKNLHQKEEKFRILFHEAPYGIMISDEDNTILDVNETACRILGYAKEALIGVNAAQIIHPDDLKGRPVITQQEIQKTGQVVSERRYKRSDGTYIQVEVVLKAIEDSSRHFVFFKDISEYKLTKKALQESEIKYRTLFEKAGDAIFFMEAEGENAGRIIDANFVAAQMHGYSVKEVLGKNIKAFDIPEDAKKAPDRIQKMLDGEWIRTQVTHLRKDGSRFPVEVSAGIIKINNKKYILAFDRDISEYKKNREALKEQLTFFQTLIDTIPNPIFYKDDAGIYIGCNKAFEEYIGFKTDMLKGKSVDDIAPENLAATYRKSDEALLKSKGTQNYEAQVKYADGTLRDVIFNKAVFLKDGDTVGGLVGVMVDITQRKQAEKEKIELETKLYQAQKLEAIGNLSAGIAHDFNNILSGIMGSSQLAKLHVDDSGQLNKDIERIIKGTQRAAELVQQILTFSRQSEYKKKPIKVSLVVKEALKLLRSSIPSTIQIREKNNSTLMAMADPGRVHQVVMNLCTNAYHAMKDTGGILTVGVNEIEFFKPDSTPKLSILPGKYLDLEVSDTGHGIDAENMDKIFDPYFTTKRPDSGTGLGLAVVHGIIEEHGGYIKVYSKKGQGSIFHVFLPAIRGNQEINGLKNTKEPLIFGSETIMLVDDEEHILSTTKEFLENYGYTVNCFANGMKAFHEFKKDPHQFDLVISDMTMPFMTGDELSRNMLKIRSDLPIILCSGYSENSTNDKLKELGVIKFMQKPIHFKQLMGAIRQVLDESEKP